MFKSCFNTVLFSLIIIVIVSIFIPIFFSTTVTLNEEYYSNYNINFSSVSSSFLRFLLDSSL